MPLDYDLNEYRAVMALHNAACEAWEADDGRLDLRVGRPVPERDDARLLELAATAAGYTWRADVAQQRGFEGVLGLWIPELTTLWNPLADGDAALRLAAELGITVARDEWDGVFYATATPPGTHQGYDEPHLGNPLLAACRAIVRCAASMASSKTPNARVQPP